MSDKSYIWDCYSNASPEVQRQTLEEIDKRLPTMTAKEVVAYFTGAPAEIFLIYIINLPWQIQVDVYKNCVPIGAYDAVGRLLDVKAKEKLGLKPKYRRLSVLG